MSCKTSEPDFLNNPCWVCKVFCHSRTQIEIFDMKKFAAATAQTRAFHAIRDTANSCKVQLHNKQDAKERTMNRGLTISSAGMRSEKFSVRPEVQAGFSEFLTRKHEGKDCLTLAPERNQNKKIAMKDQMRPCTIDFKWRKLADNLRNIFKKT